MGGADRNESKDYLWYKCQNGCGAFVIDYLILPLTKRGIFRQKAVLYQVKYINPSKTLGGQSERLLEQYHIGYHTKNNLIR